MNPNASNGHDLGQAEAEIGDPGGTIESPGEKNAHDQIGQLNECRREIMKVRTEGQLHWNQAEQLKAYRSIVKEYALLLEPYLRDPALQSDDGVPLWERQGIATYTVHPTPPVREIEAKHHNFKEDYLTDAPESVKVRLDGIQDFIQLAEEERTVSWTYHAPSCPEEEYHSTMDVAPDYDALTRVTSELDVFRRRVGLGLDVSENKDPLQL
jgi:hypothetical protein